VNNQNYQVVTDRIIAELEKGVRPWQRSWTAGGPVEFGAMQRPLRANGKPYTGVNTIALWCAAQARGFSSRYWFTFKGAKEAGGSVRKGAKSELAFFVGQHTVTDTDASGEESERSVNFLRAYCVFNADECDGLPAKYYDATAPIAPAVGRDAHTDAFVAATGAQISHGGDKAYYQPSTDAIRMPAFQQFDRPESYYATLLHELAHWTGADTRLARGFGLSKRFGDDHYAAEELIAELAAAFLCADLGLSDAPRPDHASYLASWLRVLKADNKAIFKAASLAEKAAGFLHGLQAGDSPDGPDGGESEPAPVAGPAAPAPVAAPIVLAPVAAPAELEPVAAAPEPAPAPAAPAPVAMPYVIDILCDGAPRRSEPYPTEAAARRALRVLCDYPDTAWAALWHHCAGATLLASYVRPPAPVAEPAAPAPVAPRARKAAPRGAAALSGAEFWDHAASATAAARAEHGAGWRATAPGVWASLPVRLRSFKSARGVAIRYRRDHHMPAAQYWPGGVLPIGPDYRPVESVAYTGPDAVTLCPIGQGAPAEAESPAVLTFHWPAELGAWLAQQDQIAADRAAAAAKAAAAAEAAAEPLPLAA
jgi:antirestriction protein ArdC